MDQRVKAVFKRARKAAKREEDARRTEEGRAYTWGTSSWLGASTPMGIWDAVEKWWRGYDDGWDYEPRWRARLSHRRSLPWVGRTWFDSEAQFFRTRTPRSYMTRAWRSMARVRRHIAWMDRRDAR